MNCKSLFRLALPVTALMLLLNTTEQSKATTYATSVTNASGTVSFRLNDNADNVKVVSSNGGVTNDLGPVSKGLTVTNLGIASGHIKVVVTRSAPAGYVQISNDGFQDNGVYVNKYEQPRGVVVDKNAANPSFGRIYIANGRGQSDTSGTYVRTTYQGIYMLNADDTVALDTGTFPRTAGLPFTAGNTVSPMRLTIGKDDNLLYISDFSDPSGGLYVTGLDVEANSVATNALAGVGDLGFGSTTHGSTYGVAVEGAFASSNLRIFTIDEDLPPTKSVWRYNVNAGPFPFEGSPNGPLHTMTIGNFSCKLVKGGGSNYLYCTQNRSSGTEVDGSGVRVFTDDGTQVTDSQTASRALLGNPSAADLFRNTLAADISPDGKTLALLRGASFGHVLLVPLTNGVFDFAGTNAFSYGLPASDSTRDLAFDAAGNIYVVSSAFSGGNGEWLRIFARGGSTIVTTGTDGTFEMTTPPTLASVAASAETANEQGPVNGQFTLTRTGDNSAPLTVSYAISGTAINGTDYSAVSESITFPAGVISTNIPVTVTDDSEAELTETVVLTIAASVNYGIGAASATISILDSEAPQISVATATPNQLLESYAPSKVALQLTRRGLLAPAVNVNLSYSGSATHGADFNAPATVAFSANAATTNITLTPINDQAYEGDELAVVSVAPGSGYTVGTANSGFTQVIDDEYPAGTVLFSDDFSTDSSASWRLNLADPSTDFVDFNWDYSTVGLPDAPGTTDGTSWGMRLRCGNTALQIDALSVSPVNGNFTGDYRLKFDMWINYNGPMPDGGPGSTQNFDAGVGTTGDRVVWFNNPEADGLWFTCTGDGADGNTDGDYTAFLGLNQLKDDTGFYAAGVGTGPNTGIRNASHPFYSLWGGHAAPAAQLALFPNQTGVANLGNAGMAWHTVVITKTTNVVVWAIDGIVVCTVTNDPVNLSTNVFVGYQDKFASGNLSDVPEMSFGLVDNLKVETFVAAPPAPISIKSIQLIGGSVEITFTGPTTASASSFKLQSATVVTGGYLDDNSATIIGLGSGSFKASTAISPGNHYYRIKR